MRGGKIVTLLLVAAAVLVTAAWLRGAEYDEQYTLFLTGGTARPVWPDGPITVGEVAALQDGQTNLGAIAHDLRVTDVHPPLYFWAAALWRRAVGDGLFAARLLSVLCGVAALGLIAVIARRTATPVVAAMLLTLGCYGFVYTSVVARGFALAQLLDVAGVAVLLSAERRAWHTLCAGMLLGAAGFTNYLASFVGCAALFFALVTSWRSVRWAALGFMAWLPADLWFFLAQRSSRAGQFEPFGLTSSAIRLARYGTAILFGGLPLYVSGTAQYVVVAAITALMLALTGIAIIRWRRVHPLFLLAAAAPPLGLIVLGLVFNNTAIELRYLAFAAPFIALLMASVLPRALLCAVLSVQAVSLAGLMLRPETMQPARATATAAAALVGDGVVLVPHGNDGVGIVGAFANEAPATLRLLMVRPSDTPERILARIGATPRVVLALLGQDADSRATIPHMREAFATPCWRPAGQGFNVLAFERICGEE